MKKMMIVLTTVVVVACLRAEGGDWDIPAEKEKFHIFILMGQSNMAGGIKGDHLLPEDKKPVPHIVHIPTPTTRNFSWKPAAHPLHIRRKRPKSFGPGLPFAQEYLKRHPGVTVGLIPVAKGGARIDILKKGSNIYEDAMKKAKFAAEKGTIKGVLWHQGESDCRDERRESYEGKLHKLIADVRTDLQIKDLLFIVGNLPEFRVIGKQPKAIRGIREIMAILRRVPEKIKNTGFVETTGLTACDAPKYSHFDRKSYITLGKRYYEAYESLVNNRQAKAINTNKLWYARPADDSARKISVDKARWGAKFSKEALPLGTTLRATIFFSHNNISFPDFGFFYLLLRQNGQKVTRFLPPSSQRPLRFFNFSFFSAFSP